MYTQSRMRGSGPSTSCRCQLCRSAFTCVPEIRARLAGAIYVAISGYGHGPDSVAAVRTASVERCVFSSNNCLRPRSSR
jgi:hypothetical protein